MGEPRSDFDVRFFSYENMQEEDLPFLCEHEDFDLPSSFEEIALSESKRSFTLSGCAIAYSAFTTNIFTIPVDAAFPIMISWDNNLFLDDYVCGAGESWISELARGEFLQSDFCPERINYDSISLTGMNSIVLDLSLIHI